MAASDAPDDGLVIRLNAEESLRFAKMLARKPRKPNKHMLAALRNYRRLIQQDQSSARSRKTNTATGEAPVKGQATSLRPRPCGNKRAKAACA